MRSSIWIENFELTAYLSTLYYVSLEEYTDNWIKVKIKKPVSSIKYF